MNVERKTDTCIGKACPMYNSKKKIKCQFLKLFTWTTPHNQVYQTLDCAPQRAVELAADTYNIVLNLQRAHEQERNAYHGLKNKVNSLVGKEPDVALIRIEGNDVNLLAIEER